jgi:hypothetical protein
MSMKGTGDYRAAIEAVDREVALLSELEREAVADGTTLVALGASWGELRSHLATGTFPGAFAAAHGPGEGTR